MHAYLYVCTFLVCFMPFSSWSQTDLPSDFQWITALIVPSFKITRIDDSPRAFVCVLWLLTSAARGDSPVPPYATGPALFLARCASREVHRAIVGPSQFLYTHHLEVGARPLSLHRAARLCGATLSLLAKH